MKIIVARLFKFAQIFGIIGTITLSGCGVRGPLYIPTVPPEPEKPSQPEPVGKQWPSPVPPSSTSNSTK